jgi:hypothetical protein
VGQSSCVPSDLYRAVLQRVQAHAKTLGPGPLLVPAAPRCAAPDKPSAREVEARSGVYSLRAELRRVSQSERERFCGALVVEHVDTEPSIELRQDAGQVRASWRGLMQCGHIWTCPVCSRKLRTERGKRVVAAVEGLRGRWQMLTATLRHNAGMALDDEKTGGKVTKPGTYGALTRAWRRTRQGGKVQAIWSERVTASVRATEVTYAEHGAHPHVHVLLRTSEWTDEERQLLLDKYREAIARELGTEGTPDAVHALTWSEPFDADDARGRALYVAKLGLELSGAGKVGKKGSRTHWQVAQRAAAGDSRARALWSRFYAATKGRRMLELDARANEAADAFLQQDPVDGSGEAMGSIRVRRDDVRALRFWERHNRGIFAEILRAAETQGELAVRWYLKTARARLESHEGIAFTGEHHGRAGPDPGPRH